MKCCDADARCFKDQFVSHLRGYCFTCISAHGLDSTPLPGPTTTQKLLDFVSFGWTWVSGLPPFLPQNFRLSFWFVFQNLASRLPYPPCGSTTELCHFWFGLQNFGPWVDLPPWDHNPKMFGPMLLLVRHPEFGPPNLCPPPATTNQNFVVC